MDEDKRKLTIAIASAMFFPGLGGAQVMLHNLVIELQDRGHEVVVLPSFSQYLQLRRRGDLERFPYRIRPLLPKQYSGIRRLPVYMNIQRAYLAQIQRRYDVDVWQAFATYPAGAAVADFASRRDVPAVVRTCGSDIQIDERLEYGIRRDPEIDRLVQRYTTRCDRMIALTDSVVADCIDIGMAREDIEVIGCAVDLERFDSITVDERQLRDRYDIPTDAFTFVTVGRNHPKKGFKNLVKAMSTLRDRIQREIHLVFVGRDMDPLRAQAERLGVRELISFVGEVQPRVEDDAYQLPPTGVIELYKASDSVVFPSLLETFGNVNIEAMAAGTPLVGTTAPGSRDIIDHEENGLKATAGSPEDLAAQMRHLIDDPELRERLVQNARETIQSQYTWDVITDRYESLYRTLTRPK